MSQRGVDWSSLVRSEDWWAVWLGFLLLGLFAGGSIAWLPKIGAWTTDPALAIRSSDIPYFLVLGLGLLALTSVAVRAMKANLRSYLAGFPVIFVTSLLAFLLANQTAIKSDYGLEYPIWALLFGLAVSNTVGVPMWLKAGARTELFIKIGLVLLGAEILFQTIMKAGIAGMTQAVLVVLAVWYFCYFLALKAGLEKSFASILSSGVSICGVSAAIAAGGAVKGDPKQVSYTISLILLVAVPMLIAEPMIARYLALPAAVAGAWIGGTIDTTPAVVAAGSLYSEGAMTYAVIVKMSQNALIGVAAFLLALYWTLKVEVKASAERRPSLKEIWYRFPKFIVGFILASAVFSMVLVPSVGETAVAVITGLTSSLRAWFFCIAFVCIGLDTKFTELLKMGGGKPAVVFIAAQLFNILLTFALASLLFSGSLVPA
jgi:uncharacterized integral membrane protein (TIGR00698 family)